MQDGAAGAVAGFGLSGNPEGLIAAVRDSDIRHRIAYAPHPPVSPLLDTVNLLGPMKSL